jgi:peptidyl-prolyl cis-trans isomerase SurA
MKKISVLVLSAFLLAQAIAQPGAGGPRILADKIIGVVGDKVVLQSEITNQVLDYKRQGVAVPENAACVILDRALKNKALAIQAEKDSLVINDEDIQSEIDNRIRYFIQQYGSEEELVRVANKSIFQIKEEFRDPIKERKLAEAMERKIVEYVRITPNEVKDYFNKLIQDSLPYYEAMLEVSELSLTPKMSPDVESYLKGQLDEWRIQVSEGRKNFAALASLYSQDPGTKNNGGEFVMNRATDKSSVDPVFFRTAFSLRPGEVSPVIRSKFGLHIIQMVERKGDIATVRHILLLPRYAEEDLVAAQSKLDSIRTEIMAKRLLFSKAVDLYGDNPDTKFTGGKKYGRNEEGELTSLLPIDKFDKDLIPMLKDLKIGEICKPSLVKDEAGAATAARIVVLERTTEAHRQNLKDDYSDIARKALEDKKSQAMEDWFKKNLPNFYTKINKEYAGCQSISVWQSSN